jgi:hypothetical protein
LLVAGARIAWASDPASAQLTMGAEARVQAASNPLLLPGDDRDAILAEASVRPRYRTISATGDVLEVAGVLTGRTFSRLYRDYLLGSLRGSGTLRDSERLSASASVGYVRDLAGDAIAASVAAAIAPQSVRNLWQTAADLTWRPDARTTIRPAIAAERATFSDSVLLRDTGSARLEIALLRLLSAQTWVGVRPLATVSRTAGQPGLTRAAGFAVLDSQLSPTVHLRAEAGMEHVDAAPATALLARRPAATAVAGSIDLCQRRARTDLCALASLGSEVSALTGFQRRLAGGLTLSHRIDERWTLVAQADYQRIAAPRGAAAAIPVRDLDALAALLRFDRRTGPATTLSGELSYAQRGTGAGSTPRSLYAGVRFRWEPRVR